MPTVFNKSVILTGGAGDIAQAAVTQFVQAGAKVMLVDVNEGKLRDIADRFDASSVRYCVADVTSESDTAAFVAATLDAFGTVDVLLANAGIEGAVAPIADMDTRDFQKVLDINVTGVFLGVKHVFPIMAANGGGSIVITSSIAGVSGAPGMSAYAASKHAVVGLMRSCAREGGAHNIRVNTVNPAPAEGRMMRSLELGLNPDDPEAQYADIKTAIPMERYARPDDIANMMLFLASDESAFLNGSLYMVDGGMTA